MNALRYFLTVLILGLALNAAAQEQDTTDSVGSQKSKSKLMLRLRQVQHHLDTKAKSKVDSHYIEVPKKPWRVILRYKENTVDVDYSQSADIPATNEHSDWNLCFFRFNLDLRLGIAYNFSNYFIGAQAQFNNFNYKNDHCKINIYDAYANVSFGVRL